MAQPRAFGRLTGANAMGSLTSLGIMHGPVPPPMDSYEGQWLPFSAWSHRHTFKTCVDHEGSSGSISVSHIGVPHLPHAGLRVWVKEKIDGVCTVRVPPNGPPNL